MKRTESNLEFTSRRRQRDDSFTLPVIAKSASRNALKSEYVAQHSLKHGEEHPLASSSRFVPVNQTSQTNCLDTANPCNDTEDTQKKSNIKLILREAFKIKKPLKVFCCYNRANARNVLAEYETSQLACERTLRAKGRHRAAKSTEIVGGKFAGGDGKLQADDYVAKKLARRLELLHFRK
eukprot:TRINITY_DN5420_c0_g1_i2.p1 TRINITY_DN5420_c0_g1~~TRINITY_DN5420_c0_g1_i2.p1  ORF type:complete len:180 (-),score=27.23 TRINITY_DN5420_c0_g1_i2:89-628(-)